jgi:hypothetical protein
LGRFCFALKEDDMTTAVTAVTEPQQAYLSTPISNATTTISELEDNPDGIHSGRADYVAIATEGLNRGFRVTPVHPLEKRGVLYNWNRQPTTTLSEVLQHAKDFPYHNVGWGALSSLERSAESFGHGIERLTNETHDRLAR